MLTYIDLSTASATWVILLLGLPVITFLSLIDAQTNDLKILFSKLSIAGVWCLLIANSLYAYNSTLNSVLNVSLLGLVIAHLGLCCYFKAAIKRHHHHVFEGFILTLVFGLPHVYQWQQHEKAQTQTRLLNK